MAEEHINTAFGALGALDVIFRRCMEGFAFWQRINDSSESSKNFQTLLDFQRARLSAWAQEWDIGSNNHPKDPRFCMLEGVVTSHLQLIYQVFSGFGTAGIPLPVLDQTRAIVSMDLLPRFIHLGTSSDPYTLRNPDPPTGAGWAFSMDNVKWALQEDKLKDGLALLRTLLNDLYSILPPQRSDPAGALILSNMLTTQDPNELVRISRVENNDLTYAALAWMKSIAYRPYGAQLGNKQLHRSQLVPTNREKGEAKFMASYQGKFVFVEEKHCTAPWDQLESLRILRARVDSIVARLQNPDKPVDLRTLPCWGGVCSPAQSTSDDVVTWTYGIVYRADYPKFISLQKILRPKERNSEAIGRLRGRFPLGKRFAVAQMLSRALMYLHLAGWLHKAIRSENVIFFVDEEGHIQSSSPYLVGFEYSRPDLPGEQTENVSEMLDHKYYRHPKASAVPVADFMQPLGGPGRYSKTYDIYSLGVVLLEIGLFMDARKIVGRRLESKDPTLDEIRTALVEKAIPDLCFTMGDIYADAVLTCLDGSLDTLLGEPLDKAFYKKVVCQLDACKA